MPDPGVIRMINGHRVLVLIDQNGDECGFWLHGEDLRYVWSPRGRRLLGGWSVSGLTAKYCGTTLAEIRAQLGAAGLVKEVDG